MRVLFLNWRDITHPWAGGAEKYIHEIGKRLAKKHDITLFCGWYPECAKEDEISGIRIIRNGGTYSVYIHAALRYLKQFRREYDVIVESINGVPFFVPLYSSKPMISILHHVVGWDIFKRELPLPLALLGYLAESLVPYIYRNCKFVTVSESSKEELTKLGIKNVEIVPNGVDIHPRLGKKANSPLIVYFGRIKNYKRIDHVIRAFDIIKREFDEAKLVIAGRGETAELEKLAKSLDVDDSVLFLGEVSDEKKIEILSSAWVYVTASLKEGWGVTVIEANACGTPVVAYNVLGLRNSVKHGYSGFLVENGNINALASAIIRILADDTLRQQLRRNAIEWAKRFSWDESAEKFENILRGVVNGRA